MTPNIDDHNAEALINSQPPSELVVTNTSVKLAQSKGVKSAEVVVVTPEVAVQEREKDMELAGFFAIGVTINLIMVTAFFIWAVKQWKQH